MSCQHTRSHIPAAPGWFLCWAVRDTESKDLIDVAYEPIVAWFIDSSFVTDDVGYTGCHSIAQPISAYWHTDHDNRSYLLRHENRLTEFDGSEVVVEKKRAVNAAALQWFIDNRLPAAS